MFVQTSFIPFISLMRLSLVMETLSYFFFKKLKHEKKVKKLQTDLATAKQEAAITLLELNEKIKTLYEGKPAPRGQYYHVTDPHWPISWVMYVVVLATKQKKRGYRPGLTSIGVAPIETAHELLTPGWIHFHLERGRE